MATGYNNSKSLLFLSSPAIILLYGDGALLTKISVEINKVSQSTIIFRQQDYLTDYEVNDIFFKLPAYKVSFVLTDIPDLSYKCQILSIPSISVKGLCDHSMIDKISNKIGTVMRLESDLDTPPPYLPEHVEFGNNLRDAAISYARYFKKKIVLGGSQAESLKYLGDKDILVTRGPDTEFPTLGNYIDIEPSKNGSIFRGSFEYENILDREDYEIIRPEGDDFMVLEGDQVFPPDAKGWIIVRDNRPHLLKSENKLNWHNKFNSLNCEGRMKIVNAMLSFGALNIQKFNRSYALTQFTRMDLYGVETNHPFITGNKKGLTLIALFAVSNISNGGYIASMSGLSHWDSVITCFPNKDAPTLSPNITLGAQGNLVFNHGSQQFHDAYFATQYQLKNTFSLEACRFVYLSAHMSGDRSIGTRMTNSVYNSIWRVVVFSNRDEFTRAFKYQSVFTHQSSYVKAISFHLRYNRVANHYSIHDSRRKALINSGGTTAINGIDDLDVKVKGRPHGTYIESKQSIFLTKGKTFIVNISGHEQIRLLGAALGLPFCLESHERQVMSHFDMVDDKMYTPFFSKLLQQGLLAEQRTRVLEVFHNTLELRLGVESALILLDEIGIRSTSDADIIAKRALESISRIAKASKSANRLSIEVEEWIKKPA